MFRSLLAASAAALLLAAPAQAAKTRSCETYDQFYGELTAQGTTCAAAEKLLKAHLNKKSCFLPDSPQVRRCKVRGYTCKPGKGSKGNRVTCVTANKKRKVRFTYYS